MFIASYSSDPLTTPVAMVSTTTVCVEDYNDNPPECLLNPYVTGTVVQQLSYSLQ